MERFMGLMPNSEVKREEQFKVGINQLKVTVQAGERGWTILYADYSSCFGDVDDTTDNNFDKAMKILNKQFGDINPIGEPYEAVEVKPTN